MKHAFIKRPWAIDTDIGRPVELLRIAAHGEIVQKRGGGESRVIGFGNSSGRVWLCDASANGFPCFIAEECLSIIDGGETPEESTEAMKRLHDTRKEQTA